jgi:plastocyanin
VGLATGIQISVASSSHDEGKTIRVEVHNFAFVPARVEAHVGDTIEWINKDFAPHTATAVDGKWTTPTLKKEAVGHLTVRTVGTFNYVCKFHPQMKATVVVTVSTSPHLH